MPRSFVADRFERHSLSRAEKGSLGRYSVATDISTGSAATQHWVNSVSDIYGPGNGLTGSNSSDLFHAPIPLSFLDEIEELLEDLNRLEMASLQDADDFEIDGSQLGYTPAIRHGPHPPHSGHRPAHTGTQSGLSAADDPVPSAPIDVMASPTWSIKSWDSHTHYQVYDTLWLYSQQRMDNIHFHPLSFRSSKNLKMTLCSTLQDQCSPLFVIVICLHLKHSGQFCRFYYW